MSISLLSDPETKVFDELLLKKYEESLRRLQAARRELCIAECNQREAQEELQLIQFQLFTHEKWTEKESEA